ncbi:MAG: tRNA pseudouridine(55) synthase TruB [Chloroflexota bacterium]
MDGFINVNKPAGFTSHDVVAVVRRALGIRRIGHAGTLDPAAEGVLPLAVGRATRLVDYLAGADKQYRAVVLFGAQTETDDAEGAVVAQAPVPPLGAIDLERHLDKFRGEILQRPPAYSAIRVEGKRAYKLARRGTIVDVPARRVTIHAARIIEWSSPRLTLDVHCSKGTYIRSIARDLGLAVGCGAHLEHLLRTRVGTFELSNAHRLDDVVEAGRTGRAVDLLRPPDSVLSGLPSIVTTENRADDMRHGRAWPIDDLKAPLEAVDSVRVYDTAGRFLGLVSPVVERAVWQPRLAFVDGDP